MRDFIGHFYDAFVTKQGPTALMLRMKTKWHIFLVTVAQLNYTKRKLWIFHKYLSIYFLIVFLMQKGQRFWLSDPLSSPKFGSVL